MRKMGKCAYLTLLKTGQKCLGVPVWGPNSLPIGFRPSFDWKKMSILKFPITPIGVKYIEKFLIKKGRFAKNGYLKGEKNFLEQ